VPDPTPVQVESELHVKTPVWSVTVPRHVTPMFFFVSIAVGLFIIMAVIVPYVKASPYTSIILVMPAYFLLFYLIRSVVDLLRAGASLHVDS
jgi:hypothetical protein